MATSFNSVSMSAMSNEQIMAKCPLALASAPTAPVSDRYVFISTETLISDMAEMGWKPVEVIGKGKRRAKRNSSFHRLIFECQTGIAEVDDKYIINNADGIAEGRVRIIVTNSHDGSSSFTFRIGIIRFVCENGLVVSTKDFSYLRIRHINYSVEQLREVVAKATASIDAQLVAMNAMYATELTDEQKSELALSALKIRKGMELTDTLAVDEDTLADLLTPNRKEDEGNSLWLVYNTLQENIIKGGKTIAIDGKKPRKMRRIASAIKDIAVNERLFETAYSYANVA